MTNKTICYVAAAIFISTVFIPAHTWKDTNRVANNHSSVDEVIQTRIAIDNSIARDDKTASIATCNESICLISDPARNHTESSY